MSEENRMAKILQEAYEAVKAANLPPELQGVALGKAVDLLAGAQGAPPAFKQEAETPALDASDRLGKIAARFGVDRKLVDDAYDVSNDDLLLSIDQARLDAAKTKGAKEVALLVAAGRQAAGLEEWTDTKTIRGVADDYGKFDSSNFASSVSELGDTFKFMGTGASRKVKVRVAGYAEAGQLIKKLLEPGQV
jgi:hypothetical protein